MTEQELINHAKTVSTAMHALNRADRVRVLSAMLAVELGRETNIEQLNDDTDGALDFILSHAGRVRATAA